jgi:hypothetical protein
VLGEHPQVHALEWESRFLVDPGGFEDLARALTAAYTPYHADDALTRLAWLLNVRLTGHSDEAFRGWGLAEELGIEHYRAAVGRLWEKLAWYEFEEAVPPLGYRAGLRHAPGEARVNRRVAAAEKVAALIVRAGCLVPGTRRRRRHQARRAQRRRRGGPLSGRRSRAHPARQIGRPRSRSRARPR